MSTNRTTLQTALSAFIDASRKNYATHAYSAGYLSSLCVSMLDRMSETDQLIIIQQMQEATIREQQDYLSKIVNPAV